MVVGQVFVECEKEIDESNQKFIIYEIYFGDDKFEKSVLNKVFESNIN